MIKERRQLNRVDYESKSVIVLPDTANKYIGTTKNISPLGIAIIVPEDTPSLLGKSVIIVAETLIMYADAVREDPSENGQRVVAFTAKRFTQDVLEYLFEHISPQDTKWDVSNNYSLHNDKVSLCRQLWKERHYDEEQEG